MIETLGFIFGAIGTFIGGLTGQIDTSHSKAQVPTDFSSSTIVEQVSTSTSPTSSMSTAPIGTSPFISVQNISGPIARGSKLTVGWSSQNLPSTARVSIKLVRGTADTVVSTLASSMLPTVNSKEVTIPSTAPTSADYRILLTVTGITSTNPLATSSALRSNTFEIALKGVAATLSAQANIPNGTDGKVYKGKPLSVTISATDVPNNTTFTARLITSNNASTNVTVSGRITSNVATASLNIPTTLQNGMYKVLISSTIDSRFIEAVSSTFEVINQPTPEVVAPKVDLDAVSSSVAQAGSVVVRWNSNVTLPTTTRFVAKIVRTESNGTETQIVASASLLSTIRTTTLKVPANATPASTYKVVLVVTGIPTTNPLDSTSVLQTAPFTVTGTPVVVLEPAITSATVDNQNATKPSTVTVSWVGKDIPAKTSIAVSVVNASTSAVAIASTNTAFSVGKKALTIPNTFVDGGYSVLLKMTQGTQVITLASVPFTVTSAPVPDARLSVLKPVANSAYIKGSSIEIKWDFLNIVANSPTTITLVSTATNAETPLVSSGLVASAKLKKINIPSTVAAGSYKVKVSVNPVGKSSVVQMSEMFNITEIPSIVTLNKTNILPNLYISNEGESIFNRAIKWTYTGNISASDTMEIYLVPKGGMLTLDRKIWEGPVSNKTTEVAASGNFGMYQYLKASSADELLRKYPEGKYNIVLKPVISSGLDAKSILISNDITVLHSQIAITGISPNPIKQGETLNIQYSFKNLPAYRTVNIRLSSLNGGVGSNGYTWIDIKRLFQYAPVNKTGIATMVINAVPGTYAVNVESGRRSYVECKAKDGRGVCEDENPSQYNDMNDSGYLEFTVIPK